MNDGQYIESFGTGELEYYLEDNIEIIDGNLNLIAKKENYIDNNNSTFNYTSARINTRAKFSFKYGKIEVRVKSPEGVGFWPAVWMLPEGGVNVTSGHYGNWAASGEVDILELRGSNTSNATGAIHFGGPWPNNTYKAGSYNLEEGESTTDFHIYEMEWMEGVFKWYVDGKLYKEITSWFSEDTEGNQNEFPAPFDQPFYLIIQLAVGGNFDGNPTEETLFPQAFEVDYIRVYQ